MDKPRIVITGDGSHSLKLSALNEHYHSTFGAVSESRHVFIDAGLKQLTAGDKTSVKILEIGFGTGLNALLSLYEGIRSGINISYHTLETLPLGKEIWGVLNYPLFIGDERASGWFGMMHDSAWNAKHEIIPGFSLHKIKCSLQDYWQDAFAYDLIYFDAFGPDVQPDLWTEEIFLKISEMTIPGGILVTYSAKGSVRRALQKAGFEVDRLPGPKGKREMLRGIKLL